VVADESKTQLVDRPLVAIDDEVEGASAAGQTRLDQRPFVETSQQRISVGHRRIDGPRADNRPRER
jgi:hypothetical protein